MSKKEKNKDIIADPENEIKEPISDTKAGQAEPAEEKPIAELKTKPELKARAESLVLKYNEAYQNGDLNTSSKLDKEIEETVNKYASISLDECFSECKASNDPMLAAVKKLTYPTIKVKDSKVGEGEIPVRKIEDAEKYIDLLKLHKAVSDGIGKDKKWAYKIEKLNFLLTAQKAADLGIDPKTLNDSYAMSDIAKEINMGRTPTSKTNLLKTVQSIVTAMIGEEFKAVSHDVNFLMSVYAKKSRKALTVTVANHKALRQYMMEICHRIVEGKTYALDYKQIKK